MNNNMGCGQMLEAPSQHLVNTYAQYCESVLPGCSTETRDRTHVGIKYKQTVGSASCFAKLMTSASFQTLWIRLDKSAHITQRRLNHLGQQTH